MHNIDLVELGKTFMERYDKPTPLYGHDDHVIYWLGIPEDTAFRCNAYLLVDGKEAILVDPGGRDAFSFVKNRVSQILEPANISAMILSHQDPDIAGSMCDWLNLNPGIRVIAGSRTHILLPHYGKAEYNMFNITDDPVWLFATGKKLRFIESPYLHAPGAFTTYDETSGFLFSGDIWAAVDMDWRLVVEDFNRHVMKMNLFHLDYMSSNIAARGFADKIRGLSINAILPQHGSVIPGIFTGKAIDYLARLRCGTDLIYPDLNNHV
jgi:flavorubredoxin